MASPETVDIGWLPLRFDETVGDLAVVTVAGFDEAVTVVTESEWVERDWIYAPPFRQRQMGGGIRMLPYPSRIFSLPKTHCLTHASADGTEHLQFLVWAMSFIFGLRLTSTEAGFLDATPIRDGVLTDFVLTHGEQKRALALAERFWQANTERPIRAKLWGAAVHALLLGQGPRLMQFERFIYLYGALDACFALNQEFLASEHRERITHARRIAWMCRHFSMPVPDWAEDVSGRSSRVAALRNPALHESLFMDAPLGFALHGLGTGENLPVEMAAMACRLLVALLGDPGSDYVRRPVGIRQRQGWSPPT